MQFTHNKLGRTTASTNQHLEEPGIGAVTLSPFSALSASISEPGAPSLLVVVTAGLDGLEEKVELHHLLGRRRDVQVMRQRRVECAVIMVSDGFGGDKLKWLLADLALDENEGIIC